MLIEEIEASNSQVSAQPDLQHGEALYRRGAVFGLTVAEIFILLVFILLLVFLALARQWQSEQGETEAELESAKTELKVLEPWKPVIAEFEAPEEVETLRLAEAKATSELLAAQKMIEKGVNPPCWYERVPTTNGGFREKPFYTFNLAVFDDGIVVRKEEVPPGGAKDDGGGTYAQESEQLGLSRLPYDSLLSDAEFLNEFRGIQRAGKEKQVRSYSCVFSVRVWDKTSVSAKERWKQAHLDVVQGLFGTYVVREDPWVGAG